MYYSLARQGMLIIVVSAHDVSQKVVMEILYLGVWCRPFTEYWAVPPKTSQ